MKIVGDKVLRTRAEVEQLCYKNNPGYLRKNEVCQFYMSYDNDPNTFEERWGVVLEEEDKELKILMLEGTDANNDADYPYCVMKASKFEGFTKLTKIRLDQAIRVPRNYITVKRGHLLGIDRDRLAEEIKKQYLIIREN